MTEITYEDCVSNGLELDQKINDIESQLEKKMPNVQFGEELKVTNMYMI